MPVDSVGDDEKLFRGVRTAYAKLENGEVRISPQAFTDPAREISVDRAALCSNDPSHTQKSPEDYVCSLSTRAVRAIDSVQQFGKDGQTLVQEHAVFVEPAPLLENQAHAIIRANPQVANDRVFRRLQVALARIAQWEPGFAPAQASPN